MMPLVLLPGDILFQPAGCFYASLTVRDAYMTGGKVLDSRQLNRSIEAANFELEYPHVTNEDPPIVELNEIIDEITRLMHTNTY